MPMGAIGVVGLVVGGGLVVTNALFNGSLVPHPFKRAPLTRFRQSTVATAPSSTPA